jgi:DNA-binding NarL/FixJ family response regulator
MYGERGQKIPHLSSRQEQVVNLVREGFGNKEIAASLSISLRTVKFHLSKVYGKMGAGERSGRRYRLIIFLQSRPNLQAEHRREANLRSLV